eukprot:6723581-Heterocapsa_arctica.AAC.1
MAVPGRPLEPDVVVPADVVHGCAKLFFCSPRNCPRSGHSLGEGSQAGRKGKPRQRSCGRGRGNTQGTGVAGDGPGFMDH